MNEKDYLKQGKINERNIEIFNMIDNLIPDSNIDKLRELYKSELSGFEYIDSLSWFSSLELKGSLRYINKYDKKLRYGGLLIKIYQNNNKWIGIIKKINNKKYYISFDNNYIFYINTASGNLRDWAECFISDIDNDMYNIH